MIQRTYCVRIERHRRLWNQNEVGSGRLRILVSLQSKTPFVRTYSTRNSASHEQSTDVIDSCLAQSRQTYLRRNVPDCHASSPSLPTRETLKHANVHESKFFDRSDDDFHLGIHNSVFGRASTETFTQKHSATSLNLQSTMSKPFKEEHPLGR